jgi:SAM-dependent methyltransferase
LCDGHALRILALGQHRGGRMRIVNNEVSNDLKAGKPLRLNLGAGGGDAEGRYCVDLLDLPGIDIVADLNAPLDALPDNCASEIVTSHTLEHIQNFMPLMAELHRITAPDGRISIVVPHFSSAMGYSDPTHVRFFGLYTMNYFVDAADQPQTRNVPNFYSPTRFRIERADIIFYNWGTFVQRWFGDFMTRFWNKSMKRRHFYESRLAYFYPADELHYLLRPVKKS